MKAVYTAQGDHTISSFCVNQGIIYFIETQYMNYEGFGSLSSIRLDSTDSILLLEDVDPATEVSVYENVLYLDFYTGHTCYALLEDGSLGNELSDAQTYYSLTSNIEISDYVYSYLPSVGDCLNRYQKLWLEDENGVVWECDIENGTTKSYNISDQSVVAVQEPYIITQKYEEQGYSFYLLNLDTMESVEWFTGDVSCLDTDENGVYFMTSPETGDTVRSYEYVAWDKTVQTIFETEEVPGMSVETSNGVVNFSVIDGAVYYQYAKDDKMYLMSREVQNPEQLTLIGDAYLNKGYSEYGHVEVETQTVYSKNDPERPLITVSYEQLIFDGNSDAVNQINEMFSEIKEASVSSAIDYAQQDEEYILDEDSIGAYSYTSDIVGVTRLSERYISVAQWEYNFSGGAHGMPEDNYYLLDLMTGQRLWLNDVVSNSSEEIGEIVAGYFQTIYDTADEGMYWENAVDTVRETAGHYDMFYLTEDGIVFYYSPYELASYAAGFQYILVPYSEFQLKIDLN